MCQMDLRAINPNGHRSLRSTNQVAVRFCNASGSLASLIWFNYHGHRVLYTFLNPGQYIDMDTYVSHPWTFENTLTGDRLDGNFVKTFFPEAADPRKVVNITYPMYSLKERCLQVIRDSLELRNKDDVSQLELPTSLKYELELLRVKKQCAQIHSGEPRASRTGIRSIPHLTTSPHTCTFQTCLHTQFAQHRRY